MQKVLKFRYFFLLLLIIACGQSNDKKSGNKSAEESEAIEDNINSANKTIIFFGDSLTAGYQLDPQEAFPARIQEILDSLQLNYTVVNAGLSGETTTGGLNRINWILNQKADVFILELGANDGLRGIPLSETRQNLQAMIDTVVEYELRVPDYELLKVIGCGGFGEVWLARNQHDRQFYAVKIIGKDKAIELEGVREYAKGHLARTGQRVMFISS